MTTIAELQRQVAEINEANGWRDRGNLLDPHYQVTKVSLIASEVFEAIEEIRDGHPMGYTYYSGGESVNLALFPDDKTDGVGNLRKPEGAPSELADVFIRLVDICDMWGIDLEAAVAEKLAYNATRGHRHGGKTA